MAKTKARPRTSARLGVKEAVDDKVILENVTTRLTRETNQLLTEAALRQKMVKQKPDTRQDIVNEALEEWLERRGYKCTTT